MTTKTRNILHWAFSGVVAFIFIGSALGKFTANEEALKMAASFGLNPTNYTILGVIEIISLLFFLIPRTGILGTLLLVSYMGGAIATHLEHGLSVLVPCIIQCLLFGVAMFRFPELRNRLLNINK